jgi:hypothetical protein
LIEIISVRSQNTTAVPDRKKAVPQSEWATLARDTAYASTVARDGCAAELMGL